MPLQKQAIGVTLSKGVDTRNDPRLLMPGKLLALSNGSLSHSGIIERRPGHVSLGTLNGVTGLATFNQELLAQAANTLYSYVPAGSTFTAQGVLHNITLTKTTVFSSNEAQDSFDCATLNGYTCYVWHNYSVGFGSPGADYCGVMIRDETTGAVVLGGQTVSASITAVCPKVVAFDNAFFIFYLDTANRNVKCRVIATSAPTVIGAETTLATNASGNPRLIDACATTVGVAVAYPATDFATYSSRAMMVTRSGTTPSISAGPTTVSTSAAIPDGDIAGITIAWFGDVTTLLVAVVANSAAPAGSQGINTATLNGAMAVTHALTRQDNTIVPTSNPVGLTAALNGSTMYVFTDNQNDLGAAAAGASRSLRKGGISTANAVTVAFADIQKSATRPNGTNGPFIASKAFTINGSTYLPVHVVGVGTGGLQNSWFLLDASATSAGYSASIAAKALYGSYYGLNANAQFTGALSAALALSSTKVAIPVGERRFISFSSGVNTAVTGVSRLALTIDAGLPPLHAQLGQSTLFASANPSSYEGGLRSDLGVTEAGFALFPEVVTVADAGAGSIANGTYSYVACYEWTTAAGERVQSAPSVAVSYTVTGGPKNNTVSVPSLMLSAKCGQSTWSDLAGPRVAIYRTTNGGSIFRRLNGPTAVVQNDTSVNVVTYTDSITDANLTGEVLYTTGGVLANNAPGACSCLCVHQDRLWVDVGEDQGAFRFSQPMVPGFATQWNETLGGRVTIDSGAILGFASQDDKLLIFCERKLWAVFGSGPGTTGVNSGYSAPQEIATDVGCSSGRSILKMPHGTIFKSKKGWYLLGRDLAVRYIGGAVQAFDDESTYPIASATLLEDRRECRITFNAPNASDTALVYNYLSDEWSTYTNSSGTDALWWPGGGVFARARGSNNPVFKDVDGVDDNGSPFTLFWQTGWIKPSEALAGFQRIWRMIFTGAGPSDGTSTTTLTVTEFVDYDDVTPVGSFTVADTSTLWTGSADAWEVRWTPNVQKSEAFMLTVMDAPNGGSQHGLSFTGMTFEAGTRPGARKFPSARTA